MKKVSIGGREYLELPKDLLGRKLMIVRIGEGLYLVGDERAVQETIKRQVVYLLSRKKGAVGGGSGRRETVKGGYWIFDTEQEATEFSKRHVEEFQSGELMGIRGFDGRYYAIRRSLYSSILPRVLSLIRESPRTVEEIALSLKRDRDLIRTVLEFAKEEGLVVERTGGVYEYAG